MVHSWLNSACEREREREREEEEERDQIQLSFCWLEVTGPHRVMKRKHLLAAAWFNGFNQRTIYWIDEFRGNYSFTSLHDADEGLFYELTCIRLKDIIPMQYALIPGNKKQATWIDLINGSVLHCYTVFSFEYQIFVYSFIQDRI